MMLPMSIWRMPVTPSIGDGQPRVAQIGLRLLDDALVGLHHRLKLGQLGLRGIDELGARPAVLGERQVSVQIGLCIDDLRLIAIAVGDRLVELRLIGARIDLGEEIALLDRLSLREGDLDELAGDLAAHDHVVIGDHGTYAAQVDRHVVLEHRSRDDRHRLRSDAYRSWFGGAELPAANAAPPATITPTRIASHSFRMSRSRCIQQPDGDESGAMPVIEEAEEPVAQGVVVRGTAVPYICRRIG